MARYSQRELKMLPNIVNSLVLALRHFDPIAKQAYPDQSAGMHKLKIYDLTNEWLQNQLTMALAKYDEEIKQKV